ELWLAHRTGPGAFQPREIDIATIQDFQRVEQLGAEEFSPPRIPCQRRQRPNRWTHATEAAEVRLDPPDACDDAGRHAVLLGDLLKERLVSAVGIASALHQRGGQMAADVVLEREHLFSLRAIALDDDL